MRRKKWKKGKSVLPLLLSAILIAEPLGTTATVYAEEADAVVVTEGMQQGEDGNEAVEGTQSDENGQEIEKQEGDNSDSEGADQKEESSDIPVNTEDQGGENPADPEDQGEENPADPDKETPEDTDKEENDPVTEDQNKNEGETSDEENSVSENDVEQDSVSENDAEEEAEEEKESDLGQFSDMPEKYQINAARRLEKQTLAGEMANISASDEGILYATGQVMVRADSQEEAEMIAEAYNAEIEGFENGILLLRLQKGTTVASAVKAAASTRTRLPAVWPNYYRYPHTEEAAAAQNNASISIEETEYEVDGNEGAADVDEEGTPTLEAYANAVYNDPALSMTDAHYQWQHVAVGSSYAWAEGYTGAGVKVAILDTGVKADHEELSIAGEANATGNSVTTGSGAAADADGHGTHVAGIVGAKANNEKGGAGIAPDATLYGVNVLSGGVNAGTDWALAQGIEQAIKWNVDIINMSLGGPLYNDLCQQTVTKAYNAGIAIFVSAGNDGASCINYPAHYDNVICVAAVDQGLSRADFSTYGSWVDLCAPGVGIWSSFKDGAYYSMDGTSQASPVAAGEAAVILAGDASLQGMAKNGARVDALEQKMKANVVKASGSGIGAGVTSLTKVFNLTTAAVKPQAPTISIVPDDASKAQKVTVTIKAQGGMRIYYTDNGKNPVFKNGAIDVNTKEYREAFSINNAAKGTIKAIAVNESGVAGPVKSVNFTLKPYVSSITITGVEKIAAGKNIQLTAEVLPAYATNKKVDWKLLKTGGAEATAAADKISISSSGKVTAKTGVAVGARFTARATAKDGSGKYGEFTITVIDNVKIKTVKFESKSLTLEIPKTNDPDCDLGKLLKAELGDGATAAVTDFKWSSSNKTIATVNENGVVQPKKAGKATITALANDSSGKKATCAVTVKQLATNVRITGSSVVAAGKGVTFKATILPANVSVKKVKWSVIDNATGQEAASSTGVKISNGKLTTKATSRGSYTVKAEATDGSEKFAAKKIAISEGAIKTIALKNKTDKKVTIFRRAVNSETKTSAVVNVKIEGTNAQANLDAYEVASNNPHIATATATRTGDTISLTVRATGRAAGKANITLAATDGSGKKVTCAVSVNNPVTKVHIFSATKTLSGTLPNGLRIDMMVIKGKNIQLKATLESEYGAVSNKNVNWSINAPAASKISINKSGKVSVNRMISDEYARYIYEVTAVAADGSGAKATYNIAVANPTTELKVAALIPKPGYINGLALTEMPLDKDGNQQYWAGIVETDVQAGYIEASSSDPKMLEATVNYNQKYGKYILYLTSAPKVTKNKMVTVTLKATDGSGKKVSYKVYVVKPK